MKKLILIVVVALLAACAPDKAKQESESSQAASSTNAVAENTDPAKGIGQVTHVTLNTPLEQERIPRGKAIYEMKCQPCHKLTSDRVVGPGWKEVTKRRQPEWIMNMITNVDMMLETDPEAQKLLEQCLVRMPNQNLSKDESRQVIEFMRQNDGEK